MARKKSGANRALYIGQYNGLGVIPATSTPAMYLRNQSDSLDGTTEVLKSNELLPGRATAEPQIGASSVGGGVPIEFSALSFDRLLAAVLMSNWVQDGTDPKIATLNAGSISKKFWILKKFAESDYPMFQLYKKLVVDSFDLSLAVNALVTGNFAFMGVNDPILETINPVTGLTVFPAALTTSAFTSRRGFLKVDAVTFTYAKELKFSLKNNNALLPALFVDESDTVEKMFDVTGSLSAYLSDEILFNKAVNGTKITIGVEVDDAAGNKYLIEFSNIKLESHSSAASGKDELVPSYNWTAFGSDVVKITRTLVTAAPVFSLTYDGNTSTGGTVPPVVTKLEAGSVSYAAANSGLLVKTGKVFSGWNTLATGLGDDYAVGTPVVVEVALTLYAKWV